MACVSSQKSSFQHLYDAPLQRRTSPIDDNITSHVCGFCATSLGVWSSSWLAHQATCQSFLAGTSGATQNHAQVGPLSCCYHCWDRHLHPMVMLMGNPRMMSFPLNWLTTKCVFLLALASARRRSYLHALSVAPGRWVFTRGNTQRQLVVSLLPEPGFLAKNQLPTQAPEWITVPGIAHLNPTEAERMLCPVRQLKLYTYRILKECGGRQQMFIHWNHNIMRSHISRWIMETVKEA